MRRLLSAASGAVPTVDGAFSPRPLSLVERLPVGAQRSAASVAAVAHKFHDFRRSCKFETFRALEFSSQQRQSR